MTSNSDAKASRKERGSDATSAATRITTAGLAVAMTLGLGGAVAARAADEQRAELNQATPDAIPAGSDQLTVGQVRVQERSRYEKKIQALRKKYQRTLNELAADYNSRLSTGSVGSSSGSGSTGGGYSGGSSSSGSSGSSSAGAGGSTSSGGGAGSSGSSGSISAPQQPSTSKGS